MHAPFRHIFPMSVQAAPVSTDPGIVLDFVHSSVYGMQDLSGRSNAIWASKLPSTGGKTFSRYGILQRAGADVPRITGDGLLVEPGSTNKCTCTKFNPQAVANVTLSGDAAATITVVDDSVELAKAGLSAYGPNVYKFDASACAAGANCIINGVTGNTNKHSTSVYMRSASTISLFGLNHVGASSPEYNCTTYRRVIRENLTPIDPTNMVRIIGGAGTVVYFTMPQLEELPYCTSIIVGDNTATAVSRSSEHATSDGGNGNTLLLSHINPVAAAVLRGERVGTVVARVKMLAAHQSVVTSVISESSTTFRGLYFRADGALNWQGDAKTTTVLRSKFSANESLMMGAVFSASGVAKAFVSKPDNSIGMSTSTTVGARPGMARLGLCAGSVAVPMGFLRLRVYDRELTLEELQSLYNRWSQGSA